VGYAVKSIKQRWLNFRCSTGWFLAARFEERMVRWERRKELIAWIALLVLVMSLVALIFQFSTRVVYAQVEANSQVLNLVVSDGPPISWLLPANSQVLNCGSPDVNNKLYPDLQDAMLELRPGTSVRLERIAKDFYITSNEPGNMGVNNVTSNAPAISSNLLLVPFSAPKARLGFGQCIRIGELGEDSTVTWPVRGELVLGDEVADPVAKAPQQALLLDGNVNLFQSLGSWTGSGARTQVLSESRKLSLGEKILFREGQDTQVLPAQMTGLLRAEAGTKALAITAFGQVDSVISRRPLRSDKTADYVMTGDFINMLLGILRDSTQSTLLLIIAVCWFLVTKHWFKS
jgi:hypothetical protein